MDLKRLKVVEKWFKRHGKIGLNMVRKTSRNDLETVQKWFRKCLLDNQKWSKKYI